MKTVWDEVVDADYPQVADKTDNNFTDAVDKLEMKFLNCDQPRDVMFTYMAPNGGLTKEPFCRHETFSLLTLEVYALRQQDAPCGRRRHRNP